MAEYGNPAAARRQKVFNAVRKSVRDYARAQIAEGRLMHLTPAEQASLEHYDPLVRLALMEADPQTPRNMRMLIGFKLAEILHAPLLSSDDGDGDGDVMRTVTVKEFRREGAPKQVVDRNSGHDRSPVGVAAGGENSADRRGSAGESNDLHTRAIAEPEVVEVEVVRDGTKP